jgi:ABC-2 type transport system permease protein
MNFRATARACGSLFRIRMAEGLQYRVAALSGAMVGVFWALMECVLFTVFYTYSDNGAWNNNGLSLPQTLSYVWLAQGLFVLQSMSIDSEIMGKINNGDVGIELCRPMSLYTHWFVKSSAGKLGTSWVRSLATVSVGLLMPAAYALRGPASLPGLFLFLLSAVMAFVLCSAFAMLVTAIRLNITWGDGPTYMLLLLSGILSGTYLPLQLWPDFMQTFLYFQPFGGFADIPVQLYVGSLAPQDALPGIGLQVFWSAVFIAAGRIIMNRKLKSIIIQGG